MTTGSHARDAGGDAGAVVLDRLTRRDSIPAARVQDAPARGGVSVGRVQPWTGSRSPTTAGRGRRRRVGRAGVRRPRTARRRGLPADWNRRLAARRLRRAALARAVGPRRRPGRAARDRRGAPGAPACRKPMNPIGIGWAGPTLLVAGTERSSSRVAARHPRRLRDLVPAVQRARMPGSDLASLHDRGPCATATSTSSTGRRSGRRSRTSRGTGSCSPAPIPTPRRTRASRTSSLDMRIAGHQVRPIVQMTGTHEFNEVFFTDVRVPAANVVGDEHDGWRLAKVTLGNERVSLSGEGALWGRGPTADDVLDLVRAHGGTDDPMLRQRLAALLHRVRGAAPHPAAHRLGDGARARARTGGVGAQGARRRARPARDGARPSSSPAPTACSPTAGPYGDRRRRLGTTATSTRARSRSAAARARCSATSSARRSSASRDDDAGRAPASAAASARSPGCSRRACRAATNASWGTSTRPICFMRFLPSFCARAACACG